MQKKLAGNTAVYLMLGFMPLASSLLLTPVYVQFLNPGEYGIIALANVLQGWLSLMVCFGFDAAFSRFYFNASADGFNTNELVSTTLLSIFLFSIFLGLILQLAGEQILMHFFDEPLFTYKRFGLPVLVTSVFGMMYSVITLYYRDSENVRSFSVLAIIYFILITGFTFYGVVIAKAGAEGSIYGKMAGTALTAGAYAIYMFSKTGIRFNAGMFRKLAVFSFPLFIYGALAAAFDTMDRFFISRFFDLDALGIYNFAFVIASLIGIVLASLQSAINPAVYRMLLDKTSDHTESINFHLKKFIWTSLFFSALCIALAWPVIVYFINPKYHDSLLFIPILSLSFIPRAYYIIYSYPLFTENKTGILPLINGISVVAGIASNFLLIPVAGIHGVVVSVLIIKCVQALSAWYFVKRSTMIQMQVFQFNKEHTASLIFALLAVTATIINYNSNYYPTLVMIMLSVITFLGWKNNFQFKTGK